MPKFDNDIPPPVRAPSGQYTEVLDAMQIGQSYEIPSDWKRASLKSAMLSRYPRRFTRKGDRVWRIR